MVIEITPENETAPHRTQQQAHTGFAGIKPAPLDDQLIGQGVRGEISNINFKPEINSEKEKTGQLTQEELRQNLKLAAMEAVRTAQAGLFHHTTAAVGADIATITSMLNDQNVDMAALAKQIENIKKDELAPPTEEDKKKAEQDTKTMETAAALLFGMFGLGAEMSQKTTQAGTPLKDIVKEITDVSSHHNHHPHPHATPSHNHSHGHNPAHTHNAAHGHHPKAPGKSGHAV